MTTVLLENVAKLFVGDGTVRERVDLAVDGHLVESVEPHDGSRSRTVRHRVDASSWTLTPGLVDCHAHLTIAGVTAADLDAESGAEGMLLAERILWRTLVDGGVTTARDIGGAPARLKRLVEERKLIGPRLKVAIQVLSTTGGHADFRPEDRCHEATSRLWPAAPGRPSAIVDGPWDCRKRVRELAACGADVIKICTSPGVVSPTDHLEHQDFAPEEVEAIVTEAEARGLRVAAHAHSRAGIELAIRSGVHDLQHVSFLEPRLAAQAAEAGCVVTPTSWVTYELERAAGLSAFVREKVRRVAEAHSRAVAIARDAGLTILGGTDPVLPGMHGRNWMEVLWLHREGLPARAAWTAMTGDAARAIGQEDAGLLAPSHRADFLAWDRDVVDSPELLSAEALVEVVKDGVTHRGGLAGLPAATFRDSVARVLDAEIESEAAADRSAPAP